MRAAMLTPLPPARTGVAHYAALLLPLLPEVRAFASLDGYRRDDYDVVIYQLGNNPYHEWIFIEAMERPGVVVLHDLVLHHLIVEMTLARGDADAYVEALRASHGEAGAAWARGRANGLHSEMGNFLLPASIELANRSTAVIVHNRYAAERLRSFGVTTPIELASHPYEPLAYPDRAAIRARLGIADEARVIGLFGFLTSAKRGEVVLEAFAAARKSEPRLQLLVVGQPAPNIDVEALAADGITFTGYVDDDDFTAYYAAIDRLVNLRYPSAGEISGTLIRAFDAGKPVAVSDYAQFTEFPDACVVKIAFGPDEAQSLADFFTRPLDGPAIARAQRTWLEQNGNDLTIAAYRRAMEGRGGREASGQGRGPNPSPGGRGWREAPGEGRGIAPIPLFPQLSLIEATTQTITLRNDGDAIIRTRVYGQPGYRVIAKLSDGAREVANRWLELPRDLAPGQTATLPLPFGAHRGTLTLHHALEGVPMLEPEAFARAAV